MTKILLQCTDKFNLHWSRYESPYIVGMFHDLCKIDHYRHPDIAESENGLRIIDEHTWERNPNTLLKGHGDKSVMLLAELCTLTEEEILCIRYHMGAFTEQTEWGDYTRAIHKYENVL